MATAPQTKSSQNVPKPSFPYQNGDQILARYHEDNEVRDETFLLIDRSILSFQYYPAVIMNINHAKQQCQVMFEGYESYEIVQFADVEPFEVLFSFLFSFSFSSSFFAFRKDITKTITGKNNNMPININNNNTETIIINFDIRFLFLFNRKSNVIM